MNPDLQQLSHDLRKEIAVYFDSSRGSHGMDHTERVYLLSMHIGEAEHADLYVLTLASLLHDTGRHEEDNSEGRVCHAVRGAEIAEGLLADHGVEAGTISQVTACIRTHRFRNNLVPESLEARVLFDADKLDSIGAAGIGRAFLFAGEVGARLHNTPEEIEGSQPYTAEDTAFREFTVKLRHVRERMMTDEGKRLAEERHEYMVDFFNRLDREVRGEI